LHLIGYLQCKHSAPAANLQPALDGPVGTAQAAHHEPDANGKSLIASFCKQLQRHSGPAANFEDFHVLQPGRYSAATVCKIEPGAGCKFKT
jgi:hypothetical protein